MNQIEFAMLSIPLHCSFQQIKNLPRNYFLSEVTLRRHSKASKSFKNSNIQTRRLLFNEKLNLYFLMAFLFEKLFFSTFSSRFDFAQIKRDYFLIKNVLIVFAKLILFKIIQITQSENFGKKLYVN